MHTFLVLYEHLLFSFSFFIYVLAWIHLALFMTGFFVSTAPPLKLIDLPGLDQRIMDDKLVRFGYVLLDLKNCFLFSCFKKQGNQKKFLDFITSFQKHNKK